jgi:hypothetical protein
MTLAWNESMWRDGDEQKRIEVMASESMENEPSMTKCRRRFISLDKQKMGRTVCSEKCFGLRIMIGMDMYELLVEQCSVMCGVGAEISAGEFAAFTIVSQVEGGVLG